MMYCILEFTGEKDSERFIHICVNCGRVVRSKHEATAAKANCAAFPSEHIGISPGQISSSGPGTELKAIFNELGIRPSATCGCAAKAAEMDSLGIDGCKEQRETILAWMRAAYADL